MRSIQRICICAAGVSLLTWGAGRASAAVIFDNFNTNEGHFTGGPTSSGTSNVDSTSTADQITTDFFEGGGSEKLVVNHNAAGPTAQRWRFLSGGGTPANNVSFAVTAGTDGFIGYYYKADSTFTGATLSLNLDGADGATASMDGGVPKTIVADNAWHLAEWDLDTATDWGVITGIGGGGHSPLVNSNHTIDSIYLQNYSGNGGTLLLDFVAKSDSGSIANLVPEPASLALFALPLSAIRRRRR